MLPEITLFSSAKRILSNWTLFFYEKDTESKYTKMKYSITKQGSFILITIPLALLLLSQSITNFKKTKNSTENDKKYFLSLIILSIFMLILMITCLTFIVITKEKERYYNVLSIVIPFIHMSLFTLLSGCFKMLIVTLNKKQENKYMYLKYVFSIDNIFRLFYDVICSNKFFSGLISSSGVHIILLILSFVFENINTADTVLSIVNFIFIGLLIYLLERREKINYYFFQQNIEVLDAYSQFFRSKKFYFASFSTKSTSCVLNETLNNSIFGKRKLQSDMNDEMKPHCEKSFYSYSGNNIRDNIIKKFCFAGFSFINPNLPIELRNSMLKISTHSLSFKHSSSSLSQSSYVIKKQTLNQVILESIQNLFSYFNTTSTNTANSNRYIDSNNIDINYIKESINKDKDVSTKKILCQSKNETFVPKENDIYYLGEKNNDKNLRKKYSIFLYEDEIGSQIIYMGISNEFLISLTQNHNAQNQLEKYALFTSKMTHEIKNPLLAIQGEVESLKASIESQSANTKRYLTSLNLIVDYSQYMLIVTKDFECVAKELKHMDMKSSIDCKPFNLRKAVSFCVELIRRIKRVSNIQIIVSIADNVNENIVSDEIRFKQIIINLLSNSVKFTRFGSVEVKCKNYNDDYLNIAVIDTGFGMKEEELKKINADDDNGENKEDQFLFLKTMKNNDYGSGLGLSIVKSLVKALGKDFKVESEYNKGTSISFKLLKHYNNEQTSGDARETTTTNTKKDSNHNHYKHNEYHLNPYRHKDFKNNSSLEKNQPMIKQRKSLIEATNHTSLTKPKSFSRSQTLIRNKEIMTKPSKGNYRKDTIESVNHVSDSMQKILDSSNGITSEIKEQDSLSLITTRVDEDLKKPKLPNEIYQNMIDGKPNLMESIRNDIPEPEQTTNHNFKRLYTRLVTTKKDYKLMKTATLQGGSPLTNNVQALNKNMNTAITNNQQLSKNMGDLIMDESEKIRILVVEDDNTIRKSISKTVRDYGKDKGYKVDVEECEDGFECLYKIYIGFSKNHKYKCIITDDQMRFLSGSFMAYLIQLLIEDRILYPVHIYLASSNTFPGSLFRGIKLFNNVFGKPLTKMQIGQIFRDFDKEGIQEDVNEGEEEEERDEVLKEEEYDGEIDDDY